MYVKSARLFGAPPKSITSSIASAASSNTDRQSLILESGVGGIDVPDEMIRPKTQNQYILENTTHDDRKERIRLFVTYLTLTVTLIFLLIVLIATYLWYKKRSSFDSINGNHRRNAANTSRTRQEHEQECAASQTYNNNNTTTNNPKTRLNNRRVTIIDSKMDVQDVDDDCSRKLLSK